MSVISEHVGHSVPRTARLAPLRAVLNTLVLAAADVLAFATAYYLFRRGHFMPAFVLPLSGERPDPSSATDLLLIMGGVFVVIRYLLGDYGRRQLFWDGARLTTSTLALVAIPDALLVLLIANASLYWPLILGWAFLVPAVPLYRQGARRILKAVGIWQIPSAMIGSGRDACEAFKGLRNTLSLGFDIRYLIVDEDTAVPAELQSLKRIHSATPDLTVETLQDLECRQLIVTAEDVRGARIGDLVQRLIGSEFEIAVIPSLRGLPLFGLQTSYLFGRDLLLLQLRNNLARIPSSLAKRLMDLLGALAVLVLSSPIWLTILAAIKLHDGGPVFYVQKRVGRGGKIFGCIKFRTMAVDADARLARWRDDNPGLYAEFMKTFKLRDDPRVTGPGKWLRRTSLDELPQLLNVIAGSMSLVGPRPVLERELIEFYGASAELYRRVRPGITGLWQISGRSDTSYAERVGFDEWYVLNWSLWYDLVILIQTAWVVTARKGAF